MTFRPCKPGRDAAYVLGDPGHEFLAGITETWLGPLADTWEIVGQRSTFEQRRNLYQHLTPDGRVDLLPRLDPARFRPAHGGVFHASKDIDVWLSQQPERTRRAVKAAFARCARDTFEHLIAPALTSRTGRGGVTRVPVESIASLFVHETNAAGLYHLHVHLEIMNVGRCPDGKYRTLDNRTLFVRQAVIGMYFQARLAQTLSREFGLSVRPGPGGLRVDGYEALRGAKTPRQEQAESFLRDRGMPNTPKTRDTAFRRTHAARDPKLTVSAAVRNTLAWVGERARGVVARAARPSDQPTSRLREERAADRLIRRTVRLVCRVGRHTSHRDFRTLVEYTALARRVDVNPAVLAERLTALAGRPERFGLLTVGDGQLSTPRIERSRVRWGRALEAGRSASARQPPTDAVHRAVREHVGLAPSALHATVRALAYRHMHVRRIDDRLALIHDAYAGDRRRRVFVVGGSERARLTADDESDSPGTDRKAARQAEGGWDRALQPTPSSGAGSSERRLKTPVQNADVFATRVSRTAWADALFWELRKFRWRSPHHVAGLVEQLRRPKVRLARTDLVVVDARDASHHAVARITAAARRAGATLIVVSELPVITRTHAKVIAQTPDR